MAEATGARTGIGVNVAAELGGIHHAADLQPRAPGPLVRTVGGRGGRWRRRTWSEISSIRCSTRTDGATSRIFAKIPLESAAASALSARKSAGCCSPASPNSPGRPAAPHSCRGRQGCGARRPRDCRTPGPVARAQRCAAQPPTAPAQCMQNRSLDDGQRSHARGHFPASTQTDILVRRTYEVMSGRAVVQPRLRRFTPILGRQQVSIRVSMILDIFISLLLYCTCIFP
jgi:hypothetical protein